MTNSGKIAILVGAIVAALALLGVFILRSSGSSGTVDPTPRQMKAGARR